MIMKRFSVVMSYGYHVYAINAEEAKELVNNHHAGIIDDNVDDYDIVVTLADNLVDDNFHSINENPEVISKDRDLFDKWCNKYKPFMDEDLDGKPKDFGFTGDMIKAALKENRLWTLYDEDGTLYISHGKKIVNRIEYWITEIAFRKEFDHIIY